MSDTSQAWENPTGYDSPPDLGKPNAEHEVDLGGMGYRRVPRLKDKAEYDTLQPGQSYFDPEGNKRTKAYIAKTKQEYDAVPEGADYVDPEGETRTKQKYEPVDFTANTLYHMAVNDKERKKALERSYPGRVRGETAEDLHVEDEGGVLRKPKGFADAPGSYCDWCCWLIPCPPSCAL